MKRLSLGLLLVGLVSGFAPRLLAQDVFPEFLTGTWKVENKESYEHWDQQEDYTLRGVSYTLKNGNPQFSEYLDIRRTGKKIIYTAFVNGQNGGKGIPFTLTRSDNIYTFENPKHDFPKRIDYILLNQMEVRVEVTDGKGGGDSYVMKRQISKLHPTDSNIANPAYDAALAQKLGADDYGMKKYILVILKTGENKSTNKDSVGAAFKGHLQNISRLVEEGKMIVAGPLGKNDQTYRGIFIIQGITLEEAGPLLQTDPAIKAGYLDFDLYNWYGSAALPEYLKSSDKIWKMNP